MTKILVYGWYHKNNIGDDLFKDAFKNIFPDFNFEFTNYFCIENIKKCDAVFIGGGSFLDSTPSINTESLELLLNKKIFYIGVGNETAKSNIHNLLLSKARLIAFRKSQNHNASQYNNVINIPDIVYSLKDKISLCTKEDKSILVMPNSVLIPQNNDAHWKFAAWNYFKSEFSQFLDHIIDDGYNIKFFSMCNDIRFCDTWAATEINNLMKNRSQENIMAPPSSPKDVLSLVSKFSRVITQRYHGIILSEMVNVPVLTIKHHDKLNHGANIINYYGINKQVLLEKFYSHDNSQTILPIELDKFIPLKNEVIRILSE